MSFQETNVYKLIAYRDTILVAREALKQYSAMMEGDFSFLRKVRKTKVRGVPLDMPVINAAVNDLPIMLYGPSKRASGTYATSIRESLAVLIVAIKNAKELSDSSGHYYEVLATAKDFRVLSTVCEAYLRIHLGQPSYAFEGLPSWSEGIKWLHELRHLYESLKDAYLGLEHRGSSLGIGNREATPEKEIACDLHQAIRYRLAWDRTPEGGMTVDFGTPMRNSEVPMPKLEARAPGVAPSKRSKKMLTSTEGWF